MKTDVRPAYYALRGGVWRDYITLLHVPYTVWHLSFVVLESAAAPTMHLHRVGGLVLAFFLAVGLGAHALDEYRGRPLGTDIADNRLLVIAAVSLAGALAIGVLASLTISLWAIPFVLFGAFIVPAYNLEWWWGRFHSDIWFGLPWGAFPALVAYWANAEGLHIQAFLVAGACFSISLAQRVMSKQARKLRRHARTATGRVDYWDGQVETITIRYLLAGPETTLRLVGLSVTLLALGWFTARM